MLGPARVVVDGEEIRLQPSLLIVLAFVALSDGLFVDYQHLYRAFAADTPGRQTTVRAYVSNLRGQLGTHVIPKRDGGIRLAIDREQIDAVRFDALLNKALRLPDDKRIHVLREARDLWRPGEPFTGADHPLSDRFDQLNERRRGMFLDLIQAESRLGRPDWAVADAEQAAKLWPTDELVCSALFDALAAAGREREIESKFTNYLDRAQQSGVKVSPELRAKARQKRPRKSGVVPPAYAAHYQLPPLNTVVRGRDVELARLDTLLGDGTSAPRIATITGPPGIGKTELALSWSTRSVARFPERFTDGNLYFDLAGFSGHDPVPTEVVLTAFIRTFGVDPIERASSDLVSVYRTILADRAVLVVLDNAANYDQVKDLIAVGAANRTIITSRSVLLTSHVVGGVCEIELSPLSPEAGQQVLADSIGEDRVSAEWVMATDIVKRCGGLPLAIQLVAARTRSRPLHTLRTIEAELKATGALLDIGPTSDNPGLRESFTWSYRNLGDRAARVLHIIALHPGSSVSAEVVAYLAELPRQEVLLALDELLGNHLVNSAPRDRFAVHDMLREYAVDMATRAGPGEVARVREALLEYLLWAAVRCDRALDSGRDLPVGEPDERAPLPEPMTKQDATDWLTAEHETFLAVLDSPEFAAWPAYRWLLPAALCAFHNRSAHWITAEKLLHAALDVDKSEFGPSEAARFQAVILRLIGMVQRKQGKLNLAIQQFTWSIRRCAEIGARIDEANGHQQLSVAYEDQELWSDSLRHCTIAHSIYEGLDDFRGMGHTRNTMASVELAAGHPERAVAHGLAALAAINRTTDDYGKAAVHRNLHRVYKSLNDWEQAIAHGESAAQLYRVDAPANEAHILISLISVYQQLGHADKERRAAERAHAILDKLPEKRSRDEETRARLAALLAN